MAKARAEIIQMGVAGGSRARAALLAAGRRLFSEQPADAVTIDDIVSAAGVGKGSFYNHFSTRLELLGSIAGEISAEVERTTIAANRSIDDPAHRVARAICSYLRYALHDPISAGLLIRLLGDPMTPNRSLNRNAAADMSSGLRSGRFRFATVEVAVLFVVGAAQTGLIQVSQEPNESHAIAVAQQLVAMILAGLGVAPAEAGELAARSAEEIIRLAVDCQPDSVQP